MQKKVRIASGYLYVCLFPRLLRQYRAEASARSILTYFIYAPVFRAVVTRALPSPCGPAFGCCLRFAPAPCYYCHGWHVCRLCIVTGMKLSRTMQEQLSRSKSLLQKIRINRGTLILRNAYIEVPLNKCIGVYTSAHIRTKLV